MDFSLKQVLAEAAEAAKLHPSSVKILAQQNRILEGHPLPGDVCAHGKASLSYCLGCTEYNRGFQDGQKALKG